MSNICSILKDLIYHHFHKILLLNIPNLILVVLLLYLKKVAVTFILLEVEAVVVKVVAQLAGFNNIKDLIWNNSTHNGTTGQIPSVIDCVSHVSYSSHATNTSSPSSRVLGSIPRLLFVKFMVLLASKHCNAQIISIMLLRLMIFVSLLRLCRLEKQMMLLGTLTRVLLLTWPHMKVIFYIHPLTMAKIMF